MPGKEKMKHEVFAVLSGSPVSYSSVVNTDHVHWQLDYSLSGIRAWCPKVSNANEDLPEPKKPEIQDAGSLCPSSMAIDI